MDSGEMLAAAEQLDADEIADIASDFPRYVSMMYSVAPDGGAREIAGGHVLP